MNISGKAKVFLNEKDGHHWYQTSISKKLEDGTYDHYKILVSYKQGQEPGTTADIIIKDGFLTTYKNKNGQNSLVIKVLDYELDNTKEPLNYADGSSRTDMQELPF